MQIIGNNTSRLQVDVGMAVNFVEGIDPGPDWVRADGSAVLIADYPEYAAVAQQLILSELKFTAIDRSDHPYGNTIGLSSTIPSTFILKGGFAGTGDNFIFITGTSNGNLYNIRTGNISQLNSEKVLVSSGSNSFRFVSHSDNTIVCFRSTRAQGCLISIDQGSINPEFSAFSDLGSEWSEGGAILTGTAGNSPITSSHYFDYGDGTGAFFVGCANGDYSYVNQDVGGEFFWQHSNVGSNKRILAMASSHELGRIVMFHNGGNISYSNDGGETFIAAITQETIDISAACWDGERFVAFGRYGRVYTSADGINWPNKYIIDAGIDIPNKVKWIDEIGLYILSSTTRNIDGQSHIISFGKSFRDVKSHFIDEKISGGTSGSAGNILYDAQTNSIYFGMNNFIEYDQNTIIGGTTTQITRTLFASSSFQQFDPSTHVLAPKIQTPAGYESWIRVRSA